MSALKNVFPHFAAGPVVKGFGRGSKELGIPTANFPESVVSTLPNSMCPGIYYGLARVTDGPVHKMVMSVGWNPYYKNTKKSMETHILHQFTSDFYDSWLRVVVLGYIRAEKNFGSLDALISAIHGDISVAGDELDKPDTAHYRQHDFMMVPVAHLKEAGVIECYNKKQWSETDSKTQQPSSTCAATVSSSDANNCTNGHGG